MHWLPLVAMVIASALPFPHNPVSRIAAATTEPDLDHRTDHRHDDDDNARLAAPLPDYRINGNASNVDYNMAAPAELSQYADDGVDLRNVVNEETSPSKMEDGRIFPTHSSSGGDDDLSLPKDYNADGSRWRHHSALDTSKDFLQDATQTSPQENHDTVSPAVTPNGRRRPEPTAPSVDVGAQTLALGPEDSLTLEVGLSLDGGLDGVLDGDGMFLDAHPRVLFSPSPSPPEHPPLLLMLETGLLQEDGERDEQDDTDGHLEGHGDRAIERSTTLSWADAVTDAPLRPVKRDKRSHMGDRRRGEKSVCESESVWTTDKKSAIDSHGQKVTILQEIQTQTGPLKQYFYETRCRQAEQQTRPRSGGAAAVGRSTGTGVAGAGCLGVDKRQWLSECKAKQSYVRALTKDANNRIGWRWIRIDSSCVCVLLSRANQQAGKEVLTGRGNS